MYIRLRLLDKNSPPGRRWAEVLDDQNNIIGDAHDCTYNGTAYAVHTQSWAGYIPLDMIVFVD